MQAYIIIALILFAYHLGLWKLFVKAGRPGWEAPGNIIKSITTISSMHDVF